MKSGRIYSVFFAIILSVLSCSRHGDGNKNICLNQLGYFPAARKSFVVTSAKSDSFLIENMKGINVYQGALSREKYEEFSGRHVKTGDFSRFSRPGLYRVWIEGLGHSFPFSIGKGIYEEVLVASLKSYYYQRVSVPLLGEYAGLFSRQAGHPDTACTLHPSTGKENALLSSPGGWYDAGDYGKYTVNAGITIGTMLSLLEFAPGHFPDGSLKIPESGNQVNDLLDEVKYEVDWLLTMQDKDGGVFAKLTCAHHDPYVMPHESDRERLIIGKSTAASLDFAATLAMFARLYGDVNRHFSNKCLRASQAAWKWARQNPCKYFKNPADIHTGEYGDTILQEEFFWAAAELYVSTGKENFYNQIKGQLDGVSFRPEESWRNYVDNIGYYSLRGSSSPLPEKEKAIINGSLLELADYLARKAKQNPYSIPISRFAWGSNSDVLNAGIVFAQAHHITNDKKYLEIAVEALDYVFGKNATSYSFVTGYGSLFPIAPHHRVMIADEIEKPIPGFIVGGPNADKQDSAWIKQAAGLEYPSGGTATAYLDTRESFASNETCINWNAPLVFLLGYVEANKNILTR